VTPTATITATPTPAGPPPTPRPAASGYRRHISTLFPYAIDYLESWRPMSGGATFAAGRADLFVGERRGTATNTVTVFAQPQDASATAQLFLESSLAELAEAGITPTEENERVIDGADAYVFSYTIERDGNTYHVTQAIFSRPTHGWVVTMSAAAEDAARLQPAFTHMLNSFQGW
jgi:hypothetical protein